MERPRTQLPSLDLNLLFVFQVLMQERNVTRAAKRLYVTQPAISHKLQRLRELMGDPLLVRGPNGLTPTPKALEMIGPIEAAIAQLVSTIDPTPFDPSKARGVIKIQMSDSLGGALLPGLYSRLAETAPNLHLLTDNTASDNLELLASGELDFSIFLQQKHDDDILAFPIAAAPVVCWMRKNHPLACLEAVSIADLARFPRVELRHHHTSDKNFVSLRPELLSPVRSAVGALGVEPVMRTSQVLSALAVIQRSDALAVGVPYLAALPSSSVAEVGLAFKPIAEFEDKRVPLLLFQHRRTERSDLHTWLRARILECWEEYPLAQRPAVRQPVMAGS